MHRCGELLRALTGQSPRWFRAPVGMANPFAHVAARGLWLVGWSERGFDTRARSNAPAVVKRILRGLQPCGIILLHEGRRNAVGEPVGVQAVRMLLAVLSQRCWRAIVPDDARLR
jgi:peptidoglycan/xylan/chitin deacetylase (PgdA/CDA1 family)